VLVASVRHKGRSLAEIRPHGGERAGGLGDDDAMLFILLVTLAASASSSSTPCRTARGCVHDRRDGADRHRHGSVHVQVRRKANVRVLLPSIAGVVLLLLALIYGGSSRSPPPRICSRSTRTRSRA